MTSWARPAQNRSLEDLNVFRELVLAKKGGGGWCQFKIFINASLAPRFLQVSFETQKRNVFKL